MFSSASELSAQTQTIQNKRPLPENEKPANQRTNSIFIEELSIRNNYVSLNTGSYLINPYKIANTNQIAQGDSEATFYLELMANYVWAWNPERRQRSVKTFSSDTNWNGWTGLTWVNPLKNTDVQARLAFFLHDGNEDSTASTIVGSGEFASELTLGFPLLHGVFFDEQKAPSSSNAEILYAKTTSAHSINLITSYGVTTDRHAFDAHHRYFLGLGYRAAFKAPFEMAQGEKEREVLINIQLGCAWIESTDYVDETSRTIKLINGDLPDYSLKAGIAMEAEFYYPINKATYATFGTRIYGGHNPNPWNAYIGITWSFDKLLKLIP